jgi:hypothetical protein
MPGLHVIATPVSGCRRMIILGDQSRNRRPRSTTDISLALQNHKQDVETESHFTHRIIELVQHLRYWALGQLGPIRTLTVLLRKARPMPTPLGLRIEPLASSPTAQRYEVE